MPLDDAVHYEKQSPSLLAEQPIILDDPFEKGPEWWDSVYNHLERRLAALRNWRWTWWAQWQSLAEFFLPRRAKAWIVANSYSRGRYLNNSIVDSTGSMAAQTCAAGMWSGLTNPARPWFGFAPAIDSVELDEEARAWLVDTGKRIQAVLHQSNFYSTMAQFFQDVTVFGTSPVIVYEDDETVVRFYLPCVGEYFLAVGSRFTVDTLYREFTLTVIQLVEMFGLENLPQAVQSLWTTGGGSLEQEFIVAHAIEPNFAIMGRNRKRVTVVPGRYVYREVYWLRGQKTPKPLSVKGFLDQPFMAGRWSVVSNDAYGRGPGMDGLGDQKQIQQETLRKAEFLEKGVRPPMVADPSMKNEPASVMPGMVTFVNTASGKKGFEPAFEVNAIWLQHLTADIKDVAQRVKECFHIPQFMAITQMQGVQPRNELELTKRDLERLQVLGPVIDLFENDVASPIIQRVVRIMQRRGMLKPLPQSMQGLPLKIQYLSLMRLAQRATETVAMKDGFATMGTLSLAAKNAGVPDPMRKINLEGALERYLELNNFPMDLVYSDTTVAEHDEARAAAVEKGKQEQAASSLAKPAVDAARVLSETPVDGGSMLNSLLSGSTTPQ